MSKKNSTKQVKGIDTKGGSRAYNRLDMQVSQTLHMAITLYPNLDYLLVLDHYDDITLFDDSVAPKTVSYYQMKTSEDSISIDTAISEAWLAKLYEHLKQPEWLISELGLITNTNLKLSVQVVEPSGEKHNNTASYSAEKTDFSKFPAQIIKKIKKDIACKCGISEEEVDLSKFVHMRTSLSIPKHREIVEQEMSGFLQEQHPRITVDAVKTVYKAMMDLLTRRQEYELLDSTADFREVREKKGVSKGDFSRIIDETMLIAIPPFSEICKIGEYTDSEKKDLALEYSTMLEDFQGRSDSFVNLFLKTRDICASNKKHADETVKQFCDKIYDLLAVPTPIYNKLYVSLLVISLIINEWRRS